MHKPTFPTPEEIKAAFEKATKSFLDMSDVLKRLKNNRTFTHHSKFHN